MFVQCVLPILFAPRISRTKRGVLEQARPTLYHVGSVKVFCETGGVSWQLARSWKLASDKSLGEKLKICSLQLAVGKALGVSERNKSHL